MSGTSKAIDPSTSPPAKTSPGVDLEEMEWQAAKEEIQQLLRKYAAGGREGKRDPDEMSESELLNDFGRLFQVSFLGGLDKLDRSHYRGARRRMTRKVIRSWPSSFAFARTHHPRTLNRARTRWSNRARKYLDSLMSWLRENGSTIQLDAEQPKEPSSGQNLSSSYDEFYQRWKKVHPQQDGEHGGRLRPLDDHQRDMEWVAKVRKIIEKCYLH